MSLDEEFQKAIKMIPVTEDEPPSSWLSAMLDFIPFLKTSKNRAVRALRD